MVLGSQSWLAVGFSGGLDVLESASGRQDCLPHTPSQVPTGQRCFLCSFSAIRALTSFFTRTAGRGLSTGKRMAPLDASKSLSSFLNASITDELIGYRPQWFENAANANSDPLYLNVGIRKLMASVASVGTADRITARTLFKVLRAGSGTPARYSPTLFGATFFAAEPRSRRFVFESKSSFRLPRSRS